MPRRCRPLSATGLAVLAHAAFLLACTLVPTASRAQTPEPDSGIDLLQPTLEGNPSNPPSFVRPGDLQAPPADQAPPTGKFTAPSRIGTMPVYGSPTGFGAGDTGFDLSNARRRKQPLPNIGSALGAGAHNHIRHGRPAAAANIVAAAYKTAAAADAGSLSGQSRVAARRDPAAAARSTSDQQSAVRSPSAGGGEPARRRAADSAGDRLRPPARQRPARHSRTSCRSARCRSTRCRSPPAILMRRSASRPARFSFFRARTVSRLRQQSTAHPGRSRLRIFRRRAGTACPLGLVAPFVDRRHRGSYIDYSNGSFTPSLNRPFLNAKVDGTRRRHARHADPA